MDKGVIERMCRRAGLAPERRETIRGYDVFVADGYSPNPHVTFKRFSVKPGEFPMGCYVTMWWSAKGEDAFDIGVPLFFSPGHDPQYDNATKKIARVNTAFKEAAGFLKRRQKNAH